MTDYINRYYYLTNTDIMKSLSTVLVITSKDKLFLTTKMEKKIICIVIKPKMLSFKSETVCIMFFLFPSFIGH